MNVIGTETARAVAAELLRLRGGRPLLTPQEVLDAARDPNSILHEHFTWDDGEAAEKWRLEEARGLIVSVHVIVSEVKPVPVRAFVSLTTDRAEGKGYRALVEVLSDEARRAVLLEDALNDLARVKARYETLTELAQVWDALSAALLVLSARRKK